MGEMNPIFLLFHILRRIIRELSVIVTFLIESIWTITIWACFFSCDQKNKNKFYTTRGVLNLVTREKTKTIIELDGEFTHNQSINHRSSLSQKNTVYYHIFLPSHSFSTLSKIVCVDEFRFFSFFSYFFCSFHRKAKFFCCHRTQPHQQMHDLTHKTRVVHERCILLVREPHMS